jgi:Tfp pilus assembly protein PilE
MKKSKKYAFTTVELMVVVITLAILASIILPAFSMIEVRLCVVYGTSLRRRPDP